MRDKVISHNYSSIVANSMSYNKRQFEYLESEVQNENIKCLIIILNTDRRNYENK